jgi:peptidyl-prolyl cis-trans isomerase A (cyclophilin A)
MTIRKSIKVIVILLIILVISGFSGQDKNGIISIARPSPDSATSEFFICIGDQPELDFGGKRNKDDFRFAAFGKVIAGMDIVNKIHGISAQSQYLEKQVKIFDIVYLKNN